MNAVASAVRGITEIMRVTDLPAPGQPLGGGIFSHLYRHGAEVRAYILAPKAEGEFRGKWASYYRNVAGALSFTDGLANTIAMAEAGSELAKKVRALRICGADDWFIGAVDQDEPLYRVFKPTDDESWFTAGANINAFPAPTQRYMPDEIPQTSIEAFRKGGSEAFETNVWYWKSTQAAGDLYHAWVQYFANGTQDTSFKDYEGAVRAARSILVLQ